MYNASEKISAVVLVGIRGYLRRYVVASPSNGSTGELRLKTTQLKKDSQEWISQVKLSVSSLVQTELTQDHEEQEARL